MRVGAASMAPALPLEHNEPADGRGARRSAPRPTPLTLVSGAVAGDGLERVASSASEAIGHPVAIALPAFGAPVVWPQHAIAPEQIQEIVDHADAAIATSEPPELAHAAPVRIGDTIAGIVAAVPAQGARWRAEDRSWLEAAAAAAAITALMREVGSEGSPRALLQALRAGPPPDVPAFLAKARRLGVDLGSGGLALCARAHATGDLPAPRSGLLADLGDGRVIGLVPPVVADDLSVAAADIALSAPRRDPALFHDALREAELLLEVGPVHAGQEDTYRLLIGVLLRDHEELEQLRAATIAPLLEYDADHNTELIATLQAFLAHHGSTIETADAMGLHRHTVGYRLSRVDAVSGLSPYESDGRERLSLGLKADQILAATERLSKAG
jgi:PucR C-terminal helix-turn-helix domain